MNVNKHVSVNDLLMRAARIVQSEEVNALEAEVLITGGHKFSEAFAKKMNKLIKFSKKPYFALVNSVGKRIAIILIVIILSASTAISRVDALKRPIIEFFIEIYEKFSSLSYGGFDNGEIPPDKLEYYYEPGYLPEGYALKEHAKMQNMSLLFYSDDRGMELVFKQSVLTGTRMSIDTEDVQTETVTVNNTEAIYYSNKNVNSLIWTDGKYSYSVIGKLTKEVLVHIAESIKIKN